VSLRSKAQARAPLTDAAAVNATGGALYAAVADTGLPRAASSAGRTRSRARQGIPKAVCGGGVATLGGWHSPSSGLTGARGDCCTRLKPRGLPRGYCLGLPKSAQGFKTGDVVRAEAPARNKAAIDVRATRRSRRPRFQSGHWRRNQRQIFTANFSIARTAMAMPGGPRFLSPAEAGGFKRGRLG
jgi:hypothetical protein